MNGIRDVDIREYLHSMTDKFFGSDNSTRVIDELALCQGEARIDIAVVNGFLHGIEIKSDYDSLERLPTQTKIYNKVMDTMTIVAGESHKDKIKESIPSWWGIKYIKKDKVGSIHLNNIRQPKYNNSVDPYSLVQLLWREEALFILKRFKLEKGMLSKPRKEIWGRLANNLPLEALQHYVRQVIKSRKNWRSD
jgi:hypothetical protein